MKTIIAVLFSIIIGNFTFAETLPASLPVGSKAQLRAYAMEQIMGGSTSVYGESVMWSSSAKTYAYCHSKVVVTLDEVIKNLQYAQFEFQVTDKTKSLNVWSELHNKDWLQFFYGSAVASVSNDTSSNLLCKGVTLRLADYVPIYIGTTVKYAYIKRAGEYKDLNVYDGWLYFPQGYTDGEGVLILQTEDELGSKNIGYSLKDGEIIKTLSASGNLNVWMDDYQSFSDEGCLAGQVLYVGVQGVYGNKHEAPVVVVKIKEKRKVSFLCSIYDLNGGLVENPAFGWFFKKGEAEETQIILKPNKWSAPVLLEPGEYFFYPESSLYDQIPSTSTEGGKG